MHVAQGRHEQMFWIFFFREDKGKERKGKKTVNLIYLLQIAFPKRRWEKETMVGLISWTKT